MEESKFVYNLFYMKTILSAVILILTFSSCKKADSPASLVSYTIKGIVLDGDTYTPISNAKVYCSFLPFTSALILDSSFSDLQGKVSFKYENDFVPKGLTGSKSGYLPAIVNGYSVKFDAGYDRTDTVFMVKNSVVNLTIHRANSYTSSDNLVVKAKGNIYGIGSGNVSFTDCYTGIANQLSDGHLILNAQYFPANPKIYLQWYIYRSGIQLNSGNDSVNLAQYGAVNYNLNY
jgi:hypothetical protein